VAKRDGIMTASRHPRLCLRRYRHPAAGHQARNQLILAIVHLAPGGQGGAKALSRADRLCQRQDVYCRIHSPIEICIAAARLIDVYHRK
jgi:hypothetical protein